MKSPLFLAGALVLLCGFVQGASDPLDQIPGSGAMPPVTIETPLPPAPPAGRESGGRQAEITLGVWIREDGTVESAEVLSGMKAWKEATVAAVEKWRFEPVQWEGKAIPARTQIIFTCLGSGRRDVTFSVSPLPNFPVETHTEEEFGVTKPETVFEPNVILPLIVRGERQRLEATLQYVVDEEGKADRIELLSGTSEEALRCAIDSVAETRFKAGTVRGQPVLVERRQTISFTPLGKWIVALSGAVDVVDPLYPYDRLLAGDEGEATVRFTLDSTGGVASTELVAASHPDFGGALIAAIESWQFSTAAAASQPTREYRHEFLVDGAWCAARRLMKEIKEGRQISRSAAGLDGKIKLLGRPALGYPHVLMAGALSGSAEVEFVIDRTGLAQLPRVLKASDPAFGWAAATCVNGMRFAPLTRGGRPVELRVLFPFKFTPPKPAESAPAG